MEKFRYGFVITLIGMGGTLLSLWFLTLAIDLLKRFFPYRELTVTHTCARGSSGIGSVQTPQGCRIIAQGSALGLASGKAFKP